MENQQKQYKNELGNIYGSRVSKNGNWLNLIIVTTINGEVTYITCPIRICEEYDGSNKKPVAQIGSTSQKSRLTLASIYDIPVYEDRKEEEQPKVDLDLPF